MNRKIPVQFQKLFMMETGEGYSPYLFNFFQSAYCRALKWFVCTKNILQGLQAVVKDLMSQLEPLRDDFDLVAGIDAAGFTLGKDLCTQKNIAFHQICDRVNFLNSDDLCVLKWLFSCNIPSLV